MFFSIFIVGVDGVSAKFAEVGFLLLYREYFCGIFGKRGGGGGDSCWVVSGTFTNGVKL